MLADIVLNVGVVGGAVLAVVIAVALWRIGKRGLTVWLRDEREDER